MNKSIQEINQFLIKKEDVLILMEKFDKSTFMQQTDSIMCSLSKEDRNKLISIILEEVAHKYPVAHDNKNYNLAIAEKRINPKEDFNLKYEGTLDLTGNVIKSGIAKPGGMSPDYINRVEIQADYRHWKRFWDLYTIYEEDKNIFPDFDYHVPYIQKYVFNIIHPKDAIKYLGLLHYNLLKKAENKDNYPEQMIINVEKKILEYINKLEIIIKSVGENNEQSTTKVTNRNDGTNIRKLEQNKRKK